MAVVRLAQAVPVLSWWRGTRAAELQAGQRSKNRLKQKPGRDRGTVNAIEGGTRNVRYPVSRRRQNEGSHGIRFGAAAVGLG